MKPIDFHQAYWDGRHYDLESKGHVSDIPFYLRHIQIYGDPALELGCGTGRITIRLAEAGIDVLETMLSRARQKAESNLDKSQDKVGSNHLLINWPRSIGRESELRQIPYQVLNMY